MTSAASAAEGLKTGVFNTYIREGVAVREAQLLKSDIFTDAPKAGVTQDYQLFIDEVLERIGEK